RAEELEEVTQQRDHYKQQLTQLEKIRNTEFVQSFRRIMMKLKEMYQMITLGGDAELELIDTLNPYAEGVSFRCVLVLFLNYLGSKMRIPRGEKKLDFY